MTASRNSDSPEARRLREEIAADLLALRRAFGRRTAPASSTSGGDIPEQLGRMLRDNPAWAAAAAAGALAGLVLSVRNRFRRS